MITDDIRQKLLEMQDPDYREFLIKLIPSVIPDRVIGIRTPELRKLAKEILKREDLSDFLNDLPHTFFEENQLHAFVISGMKDYDACMSALERFLPYVDNWATCDQMSPKVFKKHKSELMEHIRCWIASDECYTVRFGIGMLMEHFLDDDFVPAYSEMAAAVVSEEYYVRMMIAWYFATALAKQYDAVIPYIEENRLDSWTHNKTIRKAIESYRIDPDKKAYLRSLVRNT
ncbi:MAG: DNA alkylation repair protein [Oscillospiraceae bacterium]|nr:DNA alkylation repair protein [Oscillospiraceae bacterium]